MTPQETWTAVDRYIADLLIGRDMALDNALEASRAAGLPAINVSPNQGKLLHILARSINAKRILEIGTLGGYSTIWLARALPANGQLVTLESDEKHAAVARANIARAELSDVVDLRLGRALETLPTLDADSAGPFDLIFIDADKERISEYFQWAINLSRPGSLIVVDNVIRGGAVIDSSSADASVKGVRRFNELVAKEHRVAATEIQTVGSKGYDGLAIAVVVS